MNIPYPYQLSSAEQNRRMDERTIREFGIDGFTLMEIAGTRAADFIEQHTAPESRGLYVCGKGNNAGDALVVARLLALQNYSSTIFFVMGDDSLSEDTCRNLELLKKLNADVNFAIQLGELDFSLFDFVVDGIFGTGLNSEVREPAAGAIKVINEQSLPVFSLDMPSGLEADTGRVLGDAVHADYTLTFGAQKTGCYLNEGFDLSGNIILCDLPFPNQYREHAAFLIDRNWVEENRTAQPKRKHKYDEGVLYIIAGSEGLTGAAMLCAKSAWAEDTGAVVLITPRGLLEIYEKNLLQIIKKPVGRPSDLFFKKAHIDKVLQLLKEKPGKLIIGPGLGRHEETNVFTQQILTEYKGDVIVDADALNSVSAENELKPPEGARWILTPHPGELRNLLGANSVSTDDFDRLLQVTKAAKKAGITILSKGMPSIIATAEGQAFLTGYDTRIFSRAGFGDVLAGKIGAFWLKKKNPELACAFALLDGKDKTDTHILDGNASPEPLDII